MNALKLRPIVELISKLEGVEKDIETINQFALMAANGEIRAKISLSLLDVQKMEEDNNNGVLDCEGSLLIGSTVPAYAAGRIQSIIDATNTMKDVLRKGYNEQMNTKALSASLNENAVLSILGILLGERQKEREILLMQLKVHGIHL